jgi:hypothetical protein
MLFVPDRRAIKSRRVVVFCRVQRLGMAAGPVMRVRHDVVQPLPNER